MRALFGRKIANLEELRELAEIARRSGQHGQPAIHGDQRSPFG